MSAPTGKYGAARFAAEAVASLVLVLAAFLLCMTLLNTLFPTGTPLRELVQSETELDGVRNEGRRAEGTLATLYNDVRCRRGNSVAWRGAREGMALFTLDAVQTLDGSGACISFSGRDRLTLGSNSLALVERSRGFELPGSRAVRVTVAGDVNGTVAAGGKLRLELKSRGQVARIGRRGADFRIVEGKGSSTLSILSGEAEVLAGGGTVKLPANSGITLRGDGAGRVFPLPAPPRHLEPSRPRYTFREVPPRVRFAWSGGEGEYHFQLATEGDFQHPVKDLRLHAADFETGMLEEGVYFWRVSRVERGNEGRFSTPGRLELTRRHLAPLLSVNFPPQRVTSASFTLTGSTPAGGRVFVNGAETPVSAGGAFSVPLQLTQGVNLIRVEAVDDAGNARYASRIVYGKF